MLAAGMLSGIEQRFSTITKSASPRALAKAALSGGSFDPISSPGSVLACPTPVHPGSKEPATHVTSNPSPSSASAHVCATTETPSVTPNLNDTIVQRGMVHIVLGPRSSVLGRRSAEVFRNCRSAQRSPGAVEHLGAVSIEHVTVDTPELGNVVFEVRLTGNEETQYEL